MSPLFEIQTPIGLGVRCTRAYWEFVVTRKHPNLSGREAEVAQALAAPDEVRLSRIDPTVLLFYKESGLRWLCVVVRREDGRGFLVTAYPTDAVKAGDTVWTRSR